MSSVQPLAYFITFCTYGVRLHGDPRGSVDRLHNQYRANFLEANPGRMEAEAAAQKQPSVVLAEQERQSVLDSIRSVATERGWELEAAHVRTNHVHLVVASQAPPSVLLRDVKSNASRRLNQRSGKHGRRWARHGSTIYLWRPEDVYDAVEYVFRRQGRPMAVWLNERRWPSLASEQPHRSGPSEPHA